VQSQATEQANGFMSSNGAVGECRDASFIAGTVELRIIVSYNLYCIGKPAKGS